VRLAIEDAAGMPQGIAVKLYQPIKQSLGQSTTEADLADA